MHPTSFNLRPYFAPVQPSTDQHPQVTYEEILPSESIQPFVFCYWELFSKEKLADSYNYRVITDGCVDIIWEQQNPGNIFIMGFSDQYEIFSLSAEFHYRGIRFFPMSFPILFDISAERLYNTFQNIKEVHQELSANLAELIQRDREPFSGVLNAYFEHYISDKSLSFDQRVYDGLLEILIKKGNLDLQTDIKTGLSIRQLRRLFKYYVGCSPKVFSKVIRFQQLLAGKPSLESLTKHRLFYDAGYYDQAHFIKEFKGLFGTTPGKA